MPKTPKANELLCRRIRKNVWNAYHPDYTLTGYGSTAEYALKDFQKQFRQAKKKSILDCYRREQQESYYDPDRIYGYN